MKVGEERKVVKNLRATAINGQKEGIEMEKAVYFNGRGDFKNPLRADPLLKGARRVSRVFQDGAWKIVEVDGGSLIAHLRRKLCARETRRQTPKIETRREPSKTEMRDRRIQSFDGPVEASSTRSAVKSSF